jgi:hypothetical protein
MQYNPHKPRNLLLEQIIKLKREIKLWEIAFERQHHRKPEKKDLPLDIGP